MKFHGQKVLVTGGAVRIGAAIVRAFSREGATVVIHYRHSADAADALAKELSSTGPRALMVQADLASEEACRDLIERTRREAGGLDVLVNSAAVFNKHRFLDAGVPEILAEWWPNLFAPWQLMRYFARACTRGRIVNLLDRRIAAHDPSCVPYALGKKALHELTASAALELAPRFTVNAVAPGPVLPPPGRDAGYLREHAGRIPLDKVCTPEAVAEAVVYLASQPELTGNVLYVDGGQHLLGGGV